jgi:hypothetical protein
MTTSERQIFRFGGLAFICAGVLFLAGNLLIAPLPSPPPIEAEFSTWLSAHQTSLAIQNEILFFATISLIPSAYVLYQLLKNQRARSSILGFGLMVMVIPVLAMLVIVEGRLVYPVYNIHFSFDLLKLVLSIYYGGMHTVLLLFAGAILFTSYALRDTIFPPSHWYLGLVTGVSQIVGSYPWLIGLAVNLIASLLFSAWLVLTGVTIVKKASQPELATVQPKRDG